MSDMYLTKVERKTIFTQGIIYVLSVFVISDFTVVGPHVFVIFPWLYVLGILGVNKFYHPVLTVSLSCITTFMANLFKYNLGFEAIASTVVSTSVVVCGIITGLCIKDFVLEYRLVKYMSWKKKILNVAIIILLAIVTLVSYAYQYGNIVNYIKAENKVKNYIEEFSDAYVIKKYQYVSGTFGEYVYKAEILGETVTLNVKNKVELVDAGNWKEFLNSRINCDFNFKSNIDCSLDYQFEENTLKPSIMVATISLPVIDDVNNLVIDDVVQDIKSVLNYDDELGIEIGKCILVFDGSVQTLDKGEFNLINTDYLIRNLKVESIEGN